MVWRQVEMVSLTQLAVVTSFITPVASINSAYASLEIKYG
jgi:hypothetical protein